MPQKAQTCGIGDGSTGWNQPDGINRMESTGWNQLDGINWMESTGWNQLDGINWIKQWLTVRRQRVVLDGDVSNWK